MGFKLKDIGGRAASDANVSYFVVEAISGSPMLRDPIMLLCYLTTLSVHFSKYTEVENILITTQPLMIRMIPIAAAKSNC
mgnify:CR=1 FL=1